MTWGKSVAYLKKLSIAMLMALTVISNLTLTISSSQDVQVKDDLSWWLNWSRDLNHNKIDDLLEDEMGKSGYVNIFIDYMEPPNKDDENSLLQLNLTISYVAKYINTVSLLNVSVSVIPLLAELPNVVMIEVQPEVQPSLDISAKAIKARSSSSYSPDTAWDLGYSGKDIVVAVLDTGVDDEHEFLKGKFVAGFDCSGSSSETDYETNPDDTDGHGTHVASIIMGTGGSTGTYKGVAPDAKLVDVKVLRSVGTNFENQIIRGMEWVIENKEKYNITIINLSVASTIDDSDGTSPASREANKAVEYGLIVVAAAGNEGPDAETLDAPAVADKVIAVAAIDDLNTIDRTDDVIAEYSSRGPRKDGAKKPDISAPGSDIIGALAAETGQASDGLVRMWGTSMAAPHVTGVCALILQANSNLSPLEVKEILLDTAEDKGEDGWDANYGWGEIDAYKAVTLAVNGTLDGGSHSSTNGMFPSFKEISDGLFQQIASSTPWMISSFTDLVKALFSEFIITGYSIMMPWGFIFTIACGVTVLVDIIVKRRNKFSG